MDNKKSVKPTPNRIMRALEKCPFGEFLLVFGLIVVLQQFYFLQAQRSGTSVKATNTTTTHVAKPSAIDEQAIAHIDTLVDTINDPTAWVHRLLNHTKAAVLIRKERAFDIINSARSEIELEHSNAKSLDSSVNKLRFSAKDLNTNEQYHFSSTLKQTLLEAEPGQPLANKSMANLATGDTSNEQEKLAVWQTNQVFSLVDKTFTATHQSKRKSKRNANDQIVIMLDPGHGGSDPGSIGHNGLEEKTLTLDIAKRAEKILKKEDNLHVILTRDDDTGMSRKRRVEYVKNSNADMIVSLHLNHLPQKEINLVETFYAAPHNIQESIEMQRLKGEGMVKAKGSYPQDFSFTKGSKKLASLMQKNVYEEVIKNNPITDDAGVKQDTLYILTRSFTPGVLIELSCLSNIQEAERLADPAYRDRLAQALARGVREYLTTPAAKRRLGHEA